jgi:hypothetical protein
MSKHMLDDEDAIDDINPFVQRDFSLPGGVRQTGDFNDFQEVVPDAHFFETDKSVFCETNTCKSETEPCIILKNVHPRRNIDVGITCKNGKKVKVGVSKKQRLSYIGLFFIILMVILGIIHIRY